MRLRLATLAILVALIAYGIATQGHPALIWLPAMWALTSCGLAQSTQYLLRQRQRSRLVDVERSRMATVELPVKDSWLVDSARWPDPWSHHDLELSRVDVLIVEAIRHYGGDFIPR